ASSLAAAAPRAESLDGRGASCLVASGLRAVAAMPSTLVSCAEACPGWESDARIDFARPAGELAVAAFSPRAPSRSCWKLDPALLAPVGGCASDRARRVCLALEFRMVVLLMVWLPAAAFPCQGCNELGCLFRLHLL